MTALLVPLSEEHFERLKRFADRVRVTPEEMARIHLEASLSREREEFVDAAVYVLDKNAELYRRLA